MPELADVERPEVKALLSCIDSEIECASQNTNSFAENPLALLAAAAAAVWQFFEAAEKNMTGLGVAAAILTIGHTSAGLIFFANS
jgi:hypothetical protein